MALQIIENNGIFYVKGNINTGTIKHFRNYLNTVLNDKVKLIINIDEVDEIDVDGLYELKALLKITDKSNKKFFIIGKGSKEIYENYQTNQVA